MVRFGGKEVTFHPCGIVPRVDTETELIDMVGGIPIMSVKLKEITDLPEKQEGVVLVVSRLVSDMAPADRDDLVYPVELIREDGRIIGSRGFGRTLIERKDG
jgi:hypothetical protein